MANYSGASVVESATGGRCARLTNIHFNFNDSHPSDLLADDHIAQRSWPVISLQLDHTLRRVSAGGPN